MNGETLAKKTLDGFPNNAVILEALRTYLS
jgi:hypothetical protein